MSVLDSIIAGVREDLAKRRRPLGELREKLESALGLYNTLDSLPPAKVPPPAVPPESRRGVYIIYHKGY